MPECTLTWDGELTSVNVLLLLLPAGVRGVSLDFERDKVTIVGNVNAAEALKQVKALKPKAAHRMGTKKIMYRNT